MSSASHERGSAVDLCQGTPAAPRYWDLIDPNGYVDSADFRANCEVVNVNIEVSRASLMRSGRHTTEERSEMPFQPVRGTAQTSRTAVGTRQRE
jgi:hypothetical protein